MSTVYLDVLVIENTIMNFIILHITSKFIGCELSVLRLSLGAMAGAVYAVIALFISSSSVAFVGKLTVSLIMLLIAFGRKRKKEFIKTVTYFYAITFMFAGLSFAILLSGKANAASHIIITGGTGYLLIFLVSKFIKRSRKKTNAASVFIQFNKEGHNGVWLPAIVDTGNSLRDPFNGEPVIVAEAAAVGEMIPKEISKYIRENDYEIISKELSKASNCGEWLKRMRLIPYKAIGTENGMLTGFKADVVRIKGGGEGESDEIFELNGVVICLYGENLFDDEEYKALLAPEMIA